MTALIFGLFGESRAPNYPEVLNTMGLALSMNGQEAVINVSLQTHVRSSGVVEVFCAELGQIIGYVDSALGMMVADDLAEGHAYTGQITTIAHSPFDTRRDFPRAIGTIERQE